MRHLYFLTDHIFYAKKLHRKNINNSILTEVNTTSILINILSGEISHPLNENNDKKITHSAEAVIHTNFLPLLKGTSYKLCKLDHMMEEVCSE